MIETIDMANFIEAQLNANTQGKNFLVFADEGDMRKAQRCKQYKYYTNCLLEVISSSLTPIKNISFQTATVQVMFIVDLAEAGYGKYGQQDREQSENLISVKASINEMIERLNGNTITQEINGKTYTTTIGFAQPTDGQKTQLGEVSEALPVYLTMSFSFFENGVNANDCHVYLNGEDLYFTRCVISKVRTADQSEFASSTGGKSYVLVGGKSIDLVIPAVSTAMGTAIMKDTLENETNKAYNIRIVTPLYTKQFVGTLGNVSANMDAGANLGYNVSLVETNENLAKFGTEWTINTENALSVTKSLLGKNISVYWGDGTNDFLTTSGEISHNYTDGKTTHVSKVFIGGEADPVVEEE